MLSGGDGEREGGVGTSNMLRDTLYMEVWSFNISVC
jgi:hypothetical protein